MGKVSVFSFLEIVEDIHWKKTLQEKTLGVFRSPDIKTVLF